MTDEEIRELIDQRIKEISLGIKAEGSAKGLTPTLSKWFRDDAGHVNMSKMHKALPTRSTVATYSVWDHVRRLATIMCGTDNVRAIKDYDKANYYADAICQKIYDLMMEGDTDK